jgi:O-glycosyl hydrolase
VVPPRRLVGALLVTVLLAGCSSGDGGGGESSAPLPVEGATGDGRTEGHRSEVRVDLDARRQVIDGFGVSERSWNDPHLADAPVVSVPMPAQDQILDSLFEEAGLTRMRAILDPPADAATALDLPPKVADTHVSVINQAQRRGLRLFYAAPESLQPWMRDDPDRYVEWILAVMERWRQLGTELKWFSPINEPANARAGDLPAAWLVHVVSSLGARMAAAGLSTKLVIPDDLNPAAANQRAIAVLADDRARPYVGAIAYHLYAGHDVGQDIAALRDLSARYRLPVWMSEYSDNSYATWPGALGWATTMHRLLAEGGVSAIDYLWGFFGSQQQPHTLISMRMDDGRYLSHNEEPAYHLTAQYSRFVRPGCTRVDSRFPAQDLLATAFTCPDGKVVVVVINPSRKARTARVQVSGRSGLRGPVSAVRTSATQQQADLAPTDVSGSSFSATMPGESVTTFVGQGA